MIGIVVLDVIVVVALLIVADPIAFSFFLINVHLGLLKTNVESLRIVVGWHSKSLLCQPQLQLRLTWGFDNNMECSKKSLNTLQAAFLSDAFRCPSLRST